MNELIFLLLIGLDMEAGAMLEPRVFPMQSILECEQAAQSIREYTATEMPGLAVLTKCIPASDMTQ